MRVGHLACHEQVNLAAMVLVARKTFVHLGFRQRGEAGRQGVFERAKFATFLTKSHAQNARSAQKSAKTPKLPQLNKRWVAVLRPGVSQPLADVLLVVSLI